MVTSTDSITSEKGKHIRLMKRLKCTDWGIYAATCKMCCKQYVGQTVTNFATRWSGHRATWKSGSLEKNDKAALRVHYNIEHYNEKERSLGEAFSVVFLDKPRRTTELDFAESRWINQLTAVININATLLPKVF